ncbi:MAG: signal recognition particle protein Srp54 [Candidatus Syntropharchaeia archaeon]
MLGKLEESLRGVVNKIARANRIDEKTVNEIVRDIQRALLQADVNVSLVMELSNQIKRRALKEKPKLSPREHVINVVYQELVKIVGKSTPIDLGEQTILMVGLQGGGKTTTVAKLARYFQRKGLKPAVICADVYRPGASDQLRQLCEKIDVPFYWEEESDAVTITKNGIREFQRYDVKIIDTAGRHSLEKDLIKEMEDINRAVNPDHKFLVIDAAIGQQASAQAKAFHESVGITGVIITKMDGTAKGGGALSAVAETNSSIAFIGTGEGIEDLERFDPDGFISRLLGMGDIKSLIERAEETIDTKEFDVEAMLRGKFTLKDMYKQLEAINRMGPLKQIISMLPLGGFGINLDDTDYQVTKEKLNRYKVIMDSMTEEELNNPKIINASRIKRISRGSGSRIEEVNELLKYHKMMQKALKGMRGIQMKKIMKKMKI